MHAIAINGSPRKANNTFTVLEKALEGAKSAGATTEMIHLYDYLFKGCVSCFACKVKGNPNPSRCAYKDELTPILDKIDKADALFLGSPIYLGEVTGLMRAFMERLLFPKISYEKFGEVLFPGKINSAFFFTMNMPEENKELYANMYKNNSAILGRVLNGNSEYLACYDTWQFDDYSKYAAGHANLEKKQKSKEERFPADCEKAFEIGARLAGAGK